LPLRSPRLDGMPPDVDLNELSKSAMHSAAERARLRRQQEEEEREREKERARRKAAELEARFGPAKPKADEAEAKSPSIDVSTAVVLLCVSYTRNRLMRSTTSLRVQSRKPSQWGTLDIHHYQKGLL
jgi:hypothetical protein